MQLDDHLLQLDDFHLQLVLAVRVLLVEDVPWVTLRNPKRSIRQDPGCMLRVAGPFALLVLHDLIPPIQQ